MSDFKNSVFGAAMFIAACFSCTAPRASEYTIEGEIKGYGDGILFVMSETLDDYKNDTVFVEKDHFTFRSSTPHPVQLLFMATDNEPCNRKGTYSFSVFVENSSKPIWVKADVSQGIENAKIKGSRLQEEYERIMATGMVKRLQRLKWQCDSLKKGNDATALQQKEKDFEALVKASIDQLFGFPFASTSTSAVYTIYRYFPFLTIDRLEKILQRFDAGIEPSVYLEKMLEKIRRVRQTAVGCQAPDFVLEDTCGQKYTLKDFKGKMLLLDFTASWCYWCKMELPFIEKVYEKMKGKDFEIISVYLDKNREDWVKDVEKSQHPWKCLSDVKAWKKGGMAYDYYVGGIPELIIIDREGRILSRGTRGVETMEVILSVK